MEAHDDPTVTNNINPGTHEYIYLGPTINIKGAQKVFCLDTGRVLKTISIIPMVASEQVIIKVNDRCNKSNMEKYGRILEILNRNKEPSNRENEGLS